MGITDKRLPVWVILLVLFIIGFALLVITGITVLDSGFGLAAGTFVLCGTGLVFFSTIFYYLHCRSEGPITWAGKSYNLQDSSANADLFSEDLDKKDSETIMPLLAEIAEGIRSQEQEITHQFNKSALQESIGMITEQLAMKEYIDSSEGDLRVVGFESTEERFINAVSENDLSLSSGLIFTILSDGTKDSSIQGRIGTAELVETESTGGNLFQFVIHTWRREEDSWKSMAKDDIRNGRARLTIITEDLVDVEKEDLETALQCLRKINYHQDQEYDY